MQQIKPGSFVKFQDKAYWVVKIINDKDIIILSLDAIDFLNPNGLDISKAIKVKIKQVELYALEF